MTIVYEVTVGLQESFTLHLIARRRDRYWLEKYFYIPYLLKLAPKDSTRLSQDCDVILTVSFQHAPVVENMLRFLALVPREKFSPLLLAHLIRTVIRNVGDGTYVV